MRIITSLICLSAVLTACQKTNEKPADGPISVPADLQDYRVSGNEPFWTFKITDNEAVYTTPEFLDGITIALNRKEVDGNLHFSGMLNGQPITLVLTHTPCENDMSGDMHDMKASYFANGKTYPGCADRI